MNPSQYTQSYSDLWSWIVDADGEASYSGTPIRNYLQNNTKSSGTKDQALRAAKAYGDLMSAITRRLGSAPDVRFKIGEDTFIRLSLQRVYWGKGAPNEIQDAIWLATLLGVVRSSDLPRYCRESLGIDCGGFVANFWGFGRPTLAELSPKGAAGMLPRDFWGEGKNQRRVRARASDIRPGDAIIFFKGKTFNNDPSTRASQKSDGSYDHTSGTEAFHIGLVADKSATSSGVTSLQIAESSGASSIYSGTGVNVRTASVSETTTANNLVSCKLSETTRVYFVAPDGNPSPYLSQYGD